MSGGPILLDCTTLTLAVLMAPDQHRDPGSRSLITART
jgi:hypothetical protein